MKQHFEASAKDQLFKICMDFFAFSWMPRDDVSTHDESWNELWNELNNTLRGKNENALPDLILVCKSLQILPSVFENFQSSYWMLLSKEEQKIFNELTTQFRMYERNFRKNYDSVKVTEEARVEKSGKLSLRGASKPKNTCNYCKKKGHWVVTCKKCTTEENTLKITLNNVWLIPKISRNLFSVLAVQDRNQNSKLYCTAIKYWPEVEGKAGLCESRKV